MSIGGKVIVDVKFRMLKANLDDLEEGDSMFHNSLHDYAVLLLLCCVCPAAAACVLRDPGP